MMMMRMMMMMRVTMQHTVIVIEQLLNASLEVCMNEDTVVGACVEGRVRERICVDDAIYFVTHT